MRAWLEASNPEMLAEIDAVAASGKPKTLLDADIRTGRGKAFIGARDLLKIAAQIPDG